MAKIAIFVPDNSMLSWALYAAQLYQLDISSISLITQRDCYDLVKNTIQNGTDIIIARGGQATTIKQLFDIPVIEIKITTFELSRILEKARELTTKENPQIALTGPNNMFIHINIPLLESIYQIRLRTYFFDSPEEMVGCARTAATDGADVVIGGHVVCDACQELGITTLRTFSGEESILEACRIAGLLGQALDSEKKHAASINMLLNRIPSGIIHINETANILHVNQFVEHLLSSVDAELKNLPIRRVIPSISQKHLDIVLKRRQEINSTAITINHAKFIISMSPILADNHVSGAIISFHEMLSSQGLNEPFLDELKKKGYCATYTFDNLIARSPQTIAMLQEARHLAAFQLPILISGPSGTEKHLIAECLHNAGLYHDKPFVRYNCNGYNSDDVKQLLSLNGKSEDNQLFPHIPFTLYLHEVSSLSLAEQQQLTTLIQRHAADCTSNTSEQDSFIRIIASTSQNLSQLVREGVFRQDTYYVLTSATLNIPPLRMRSEDVMGWTDYYISVLQKKYGRYVKFTADAQKFLAEYKWPGNLLELRTVCNRIFCNSRKYYINAADIQEQLDTDLAENSSAAPCCYPAKPLPVSQQAARIIQALHQYGGNRAAAASALGISTTTLWRQMNKYRIPKNEGKEVT